MSFSDLDRVLAEALAQGVGSALACGVYRGGACVYETYLGTLARDDATPVTADTFFDLASLTKPLVTAGLAAHFLADGRLALDDPIGAVLPEWRAEDRKAVTWRHLLQHTGGLPAWLDLRAPCADPKAHVRARLAATPLASAPGTASLYSDLDFITLGFALEELGGTPLDVLAERLLYAPLGLQDRLRFAPSTGAALGAAAAATLHPERGLIQGRVDDDNAWFLGGVAGHAGLFGCLRGVAALLDAWRRAWRGLDSLWTRETVFPLLFPFPTPPRTSYALGFDRPAWKGSQAGRHFSPHTVGHLGFTGTSCWLDLERDLAVVLLTNRVHTGATPEAIKALRIAAHDLALEALGATTPGPYTPPPALHPGQHVHLIGVAGTGMGSLAGMLKEAGYVVTGSDQAIYPPMSDLLAKLEIPVRQPFAPENLGSPDLVVVGNVCSRDHAEVIEVKRRGLAYDSFAGTLERAFIASKRALVVAGTHGKTTTSSMTAWQLEAAGRDPSFMIGGLVKNFGRNYKLGEGPEIVVEGDEYDSAYFDKNPKFTHYRPFGGILTSIEYDHADIYDSIEEIEAAFARFIAAVDPAGTLVAAWDSPRIRRLAPTTHARLVRYGLHPDSDWSLRDLHEGPDNAHFIVTRHGAPFVALALPMPGDYNALNAVAVCALLHETLGFTPEALQAGFAGFAGVARRQEERGVVSGVRVIDDFAHHPTAIALTLAGLRQKYPEGRLLVAFDPRTNTTSRNIFQKELAQSFRAADAVFLGQPSRMAFIAAAERLDIQQLCADIQEGGRPCLVEAEPAHLARRLAQTARPGDTIAVLSNGGFGGLIPTLLAALAAS